LNLFTKVNLDILLSMQMLDDIMEMQEECVHISNCAWSSKENYFCQRQTSI